MTLIDNRPGLAARLATVAGIELPDAAVAEIASGDLSRVIERRADRVVLLRDQYGTLGAVLLVEVQRSTDHEARKRWPGKVSVAYERHGCSVYLLVICPSQGVAEWAFDPLVIGSLAGPGMVLRTAVLSPDCVPVVTDAEQATREQELSALSAVSHYGNPAHGLATVKAFTQSVYPDGPPTADDPVPPNADYLLYVRDLISEHASEDIREHLEMYMPKNYSLLKKSPSWNSLTSEVRSEGRQQGFAEGAAWGEARGELEGKAQAIVLVLQRHGIEPSKDQLRRLQRCTDLSRLQNWLWRAVAAESAADVFDDEEDETAAGCAPGMTVG